MQRSHACKGETHFYPCKGEPTDFHACKGEPASFYACKGRVQTSRAKVVLTRGVELTVEPKGVNVLEHGDL